MIYILAIVVILALFLLTFYNKLKRFQIQIGASIQEIGNQLKRQANLIPNLIDSVKGYMKHEKGIFEDLTNARKSIDEAINTQSGKKIDQAQSLINKTISSLKVIMESNPQIQASGLVNNLMDELRDTADKLMYSRRTLIDLTADYNVSIVTIPGVWVASLFGFKKEKGLDTPTEAEQLKVNSEEMKNPKVNL
ncbi:MAG: LemA family protein [Candidatus Shapirobacteria bacterium]|nr:LemA family protein [Candidatus Shapirobacteria bacterium]